MAYERSYAGMSDTKATATKPMRQTAAKKATTNPKQTSKGPGKSAPFPPNVEPKGRKRFV